ncbi:MAG TPA: substrate-binding domain-containing protein [Fimbriimonadaceae bacterium]|jgi:rhamnose transport system substrate-binding protein
MTAKQLSIGLVFALALGGCGSSSSSSSSSSGGSTGSADSGAKLKVVFIPKNTGNPYFKPVIDGFQKEAGPANIDFDSQAPATAEPTSQLSTIKDQTQQGVDVIAISANSPDALNEALDTAHGKGITILTVDSDLTGNESHRDLGVLSTDFSKVGPSQLELLGSEMNYQGDFAILSATTSAPNQNAWIAGINDALKQPKYSKMKLLTIVYGDDEPQKSSTEMEGLLTKFPTMKGVISPTSVGLAAAAQVLENSGQYPGGPNAKNGGIILTGLSTPNQMKKAVDKGVVAKFQLWDPAAMGMIAAYVGAQIHNKKIEAKRGTTVDVPNVGKVTIQDKNVVFAGPILTFDKTNIAKYDF